MNIRNAGSNMTELEMDGVTVLFSYSTPVAAYGPDGFIRTEQHFSSTTTRHINKWLAGANAKKVPQSVFDRFTR